MEATDRLRVGAVTLAACLGVVACEPTVPATLAIVDVTVLPMGDREKESNRTVLIGDGRVLEIGSAGRVHIPEGAEVVDGSGRYLMPGLVDSHVHLRDTTELTAYLRYGVTTVFQLSGPQGAVEDLVGLRREVETGSRLGPQIFLSGRLIDGDPPIFGGAADVVTTPEEGRDLTLERRDDGYDFVKVYNNVPRDVLPAIVSTAHESNMVVFGHVPSTVGSTSR